MDPLVAVVGWYLLVVVDCSNAAIQRIFTEYSVGLSSRNFSTNIGEISNELSTINWNQILYNAEGDPNVTLDNFNNTLSPIIHKYIPLKKVKNIEHKRSFKPWITPLILSDMKKRDRLLSKFIKSKNPSSKASLHTEYKEVRNNVTELIRLSKLFL